MRKWANASAGDAANVGIGVARRGFAMRNGCGLGRTAQANGLSELPTRERWYPEDQLARALNQGESQCRFCTDADDRGEGEVAALLDADAGGHEEGDAQSDLRQTFERKGMSERNGLAHADEGDPKLERADDPREQVESD